MKRSLLGIGLALAFSGVVAAQTTSTTGSGSAASGTKVAKDGSAVSLASGTQIAAQLQNSLNVEKAKVGDEVVLKTTKAIKQNGEVVVEKGAKLIGRVTDVQQKAKDAAGSKIGVLFDTIKHGDMSMPVTAQILSITNVAARTAVDDSIFADTNTSSTTSTRTSTSSSSGGLLGGVANTVGGVTNTATSTVGGVANTATNTVGGVTNTAGKTVGSTTGAIRGLTISQSSDASANGSSTLSLGSGNLKLEKGTTFNLALSESAKVN